MIKHTLPMPTPEAAEAAAHVCQLLTTGLAARSERLRYAAIRRAIRLANKQELQDWLNEIAAYRGNQNG